MWTYQPQLDGLRTVAVYLVLIYHAKVAAFGGGFIGVDVFFVLSGFLVTNVILSEIDTQGRFRLGAFYARRVRRLLPAAVAVVIATSIAFLIVTDAARRAELVSDARSALLYYGNWHFLGQSTDYFSQDLLPSPFLHFWSLAIEEQFYLGFPVLILLLHRTRGAFTRLAVSTLTLLLVASIASQLFWAGYETNHAYFGTDARLYQLLAGSLLAFALRARPQLLAPRIAGLTALAGAAAVAVLGSGALSTSPSWRGLAATAATVALIGGLTVAPRGLVARALSLPIPVYLGKISYGTYLWHWPVILLIREVFTVGPWSVAVIAFALSSALAALSYQILELPIRTQPRLARGTWGVVAVGISLSALTAVLVVPPILESPRKPALVSAVPVKTVAGVGKLGAGAPPANVDYAALRKDNGRSRTCPASDVAACMVVADNGPLVLVIGDSFANMLGPMFTQLARDHHFSLAQNVLPGCPWPQDLDYTDAPADLRRGCVVARDQWYERAIAELKPALVVLAMHPRDDDPHWADVMRARSGGNESLEQLTYRTMSETVDLLLQHSGRVVMVQGIMGPKPMLPLECLATANRVRDCAVPYPTSAPPSDGYMQALSAASSRVSTINLNPVICPTAPICLPYRNGELVWRDRLHLLTGWATHHRAEIWKLLKTSGATGGL